MTCRYDAFRRGEVSTLVVSKVANFSVDLPEAPWADAWTALFTATHAPPAAA